MGREAGLDLADIAKDLAELPHGATPGDVDWQALLWDWRRHAHTRQLALTTLISDLDHCLTCRCVSANDEDGGGQDPADTGSTTARCPRVSLYTPLTALAPALR
ncbi:hypothetical protein [Streptomyces sp. NPDC016626]|uniref:hypothetical protein n=1 Tax=Streptomyces sp. NPDC016626 TaxID=3364968 RepID=UPI0037028994